MAIISKLRNLSFLTPYKRLNQLIQNESFEPAINWGLRMAICGTAPLIWGLSTGHVVDAVWIALTAEAITWIELKGSFAWCIRALLTGATLAILFAMAGTLAGNNIWLSVAGMLVVGFFATLLKHMGDRASGLAICVYLLFILCNAYPAFQFVDIKHRFTLVVAGSAFPVAVGIIVSLLMPAEQPFRRQIALIWRAVAALTATVSKNAGKPLGGEVYASENTVRAAMDNSYNFYSRMAHQGSKDEQRYQLMMLRKIAGLVSVSVIAMGEEMEHIDVARLDEPLRLKAAALFNALKETANRISMYVITLKPEEKLLATSQINRQKNLANLILQYPLPADKRQSDAIKRVVHLSGRTAKLLESAILRIEQIGRDIPVYRSYSLVKTLFLLNPKYFFKNLLEILNFGTFTTRYALRSAIAAAFALFIYKWFHIDHGYWLPFSVMIVIQPYFGATMKKAIDRVSGTLLGGLAGSFFLRLPTGLHIKETVLFFTFMLMVYYLRRNYAVAAFVITLNLVLLFNLESAFNNHIMITRALCTVGGAALAVISGFILLPTWDKEWLPAHLAGAIKSGYDYFVCTFFVPAARPSWTKSKRTVESNNTNVFDSFSRYLKEPGTKKSELYYDLIAYNVRIVRNINMINLEQEEKKNGEYAPPTSQQKMCIDECRKSFRELLSYLPQLAPELGPVAHDMAVATPYFLLNEAQIGYLEKVSIELKAMTLDVQRLLENGEHKK